MDEIVDLRPAALHQCIQETRAHNLEHAKALVREHGSSLPVLSTLQVGTEALEIFTSNLVLHTRTRFLHSCAATCTDKQPLAKRARTCPTAEEQSSTLMDTIVVDPADAPAAKLAVEMMQSNAPSTLSVAALVDVIQTLSFFEATALLDCLPAYIAESPLTCQLEPAQVIALLRVALRHTADSKLTRFLLLALEALPLEPPDVQVFWQELVPVATPALCETLLSSLEVSVTGWWLLHSLSTLVCSGACTCSSSDSAPSASESALKACAVPVRVALHSAKMPLAMPDFFSNQIAQYVVSCSRRLCACRSGALAFLADAISPLACAKLGEVFLLSHSKAEATVVSRMPAMPFDVRITSERQLLSFAGQECDVSLDIKLPLDGTPLGIYLTVYNPPASDIELTVTLGVIHPKHAYRLVGPGFCGAEALVNELKHTGMWTTFTDVYSEETTCHGSRASDFASKKFLEELAPHSCMIVFAQISLTSKKM